MIAVQPKIHFLHIELIMKRLISALLLLSIASISLPSYADNLSKTRELVDNAIASVNNFTADPDMTYLRRNLGDAV